MVNKNFIKNSILVFVLLVFSGCASNSVYSLDKNSLKIGKDSQEVISINLTNPVKNTYSSSCSLHSYTLFDENSEYGNLFVEYINLNENCHWNGLPSSFFQTNLKYKLKLNSIETVESFDIQNFNFKTFKINDESYVSFIYIYGGKVERLILDNDGKLYTKLLKSFKNNYENKFLDEKRFKGKYNSSLVQGNIINNYFEKEIIDYDK